jgi:thiol-disulfide isomerase/thioredoxin
LRPLFLLLILALLAGCDREPAAGSTNAPPGWTGPVGTERQGTGRLDRSRAGTAAPNILFEDPTGEPASIADFRGKPVLVNLWATWCSPCVVEMPSLDALAANDPRIHVLALSQDMNGQEKVDAFFTERKFAKLEPYIDAELSMMSALKVDTLPTTILYDSTGQEVWRMTGREDWTGRRAAALIEEAVSISPSAAR